MPIDPTPKETPAVPQHTVPTPGKGFSLNLKRTGGAFVAEYSMFLIALTTVLSGLTWLALLLGGCIVTAMTGGSNLFPAQQFVLWIAVSSLVAMPVAAVLWCRTQGELAAAYNNEFPRGGARGFRSVWLAFTGFQALTAAAVMLFAPLSSAISGGGAIGMVMAGVVLPTFLILLINLLGIFIVGSSTEKRKKVHIALWIAAVLTMVMVAITFPWSLAQNKSGSYEYNDYAPSRSYPSTYDDNYCVPSSQLGGASLCDY